MSKTNRNGKSGKVLNVLATVLAVVAILVIAGMSMQIWGKDNVKPSNWFQKQEEAVTPEGEGGKTDDKTDDKGGETEGDNKPVNPESGGTGN